MPDRIDRASVGLAYVTDGGTERVRQVERRRETAAAAPELVTRKIDADHAKPVTREKRAERIEILLRTRIAVADHERNAARTARFVVECGDPRTGRRRELEQIEPHGSGATFSRHVASPET